jgi:RHS repeat-associated protein
MAVPLGNAGYNFDWGNVQRELVTDYFANGSIIYEDYGNLKMIRTEEGFLKRSGSGYIHYIYIKDHLGNNRAVIEYGYGGSWHLSQEISYYPFGMPHPFGNQSPERQPFKYSGKELDEMHGLKHYDFHARQLSSVVPRFSLIDPLAEKYYSTSPYAYCLNNPVNAIDPTGKLTVFINGFDPENYVKYLIPRISFPLLTVAEALITDNSYDNRVNRNLQESSKYFTDYWRGVDDIYMTCYDETNALYVNGSYSPLTSAQRRYDDGVAKGNELIDKIKSGKLKLSANEKIRLVGYSMGAAYAAGMADAIINSGYGHLLDFVDLLAPYQMGDFELPEGAYGFTIASGNDYFRHRGKTINSVDEFYGSWGDVSNLGGHIINGDFRDFLQQCLDAGVTITFHYP